MMDFLRQQHTLHYWLWHHLPTKWKVLRDIERILQLKHHKQTENLLHGCFFLLVLVVEIDDDGGAVLVEVIRKIVCWWSKSQCDNRRSMNGIVACCSCDGNSFTANDWTDFRSLFSGMSRAVPLKVTVYLLPGRFEYVLFHALSLSNRR